MIGKILLISNANSSYALTLVRNGSLTKRFNFSTFKITDMHSCRLPSLQTDLVITLENLTINLIKVIEESGHNIL